MLTTEYIADAARRLGAQAGHPGKVILFGSYARGEADDASDLDLMVDPLAGYGRIHGVGGHISPQGQLRHWGYAMAEPLGALVLKQMALDFGQGQDR